MPGSSSAEARIVEALEATAEPLGQRELREQTGLGRKEFDAAFDRLRGQEVIRKLDDSDVFRLTYWADSKRCTICDSDITSGEYYELELRAHGTNTDAQTTASLHADCARTLLNEVSLADNEGS